MDSNYNSDPNGDIVYSMTEPTMELRWGREIRYYSNMSPTQEKVLQQRFVTRDAHGMILYDEWKSIPDYEFLT